ncbi:MAG: diacylglycerol kinase [Blastopirellula sp.]|nr:MAG: diacylglycerol kinase [Blastopirellula sp.]
MLQEESFVRHWLNKFRVALRGIVVGVRGEASFAIQLPAAVIVLAAAIWIQLDWVRICILLLCIGMVLTAELLNTAIEHLAKAVDPNENEHLRNALDIAAGAVLLASIFAMIIGVLLFAEPFVVNQSP